MATVFGFSGLMSRLDGWRAARRSSSPQHDLAAGTEIFVRDFTWPAADKLDLSMLLENLVIPRLIAEQTEHCVTCASDISFKQKAGIPTPISEADVAQFAQMSLDCDAHALLAFVENHLQAGCSVETVYLELLAPAARKLGEYWEDDSQDFVAVTMGLWRIQEILRELTLRMPPMIGPGAGQRSALFSPMPGEQHSFGTLMVAECFQRAGWDVETLIEPSQSELTAKFAKRHYDLIGLTVSCDCSTGALGSLVTTIKAVSTNPHIRIMIGGRAVNDRPALVAECGADATAPDARAAVELAERLVPAKVEHFARLS